MNKDEYLKEKEVSLIYKKALSTLRNERHLRKGFPYIKSGRSILYKKSDIESYLESRRIIPEN